MSQLAEYLTPSEAAALLGVSSESVNRWGREGKLQVAMTLPSGRRRFRREDVEALLTPTPTSGGDR